MSKLEVILCESLENSLAEAIEKYPHDRLFILTDEHTHRLCLPQLQNIPAIQDATEIIIGAEDVHKNLETLASVWQALSEQGATRHSLLINLGGGMVTDLGGFAAATFKREDGIVVMDPHRCIGCRFCMAGCPFGARSFNFRDPQPYVKDVNPEFPMRTRGVVEKCTFCTERLAQGKLPACVEASEGAMLFGDLNDPGSPVRQALSKNFTIRRKPTLGTQPGVYYII